MKKISQMICKYRKAILLVAFILLIPAALGMMNTRINYDILVYLPEDIETIQGQNILTDEFNIGTYALIVLDENMPIEQIGKLEKNLKEMDSIEVCVSASDFIGDAIPQEIFEEDLNDTIYKDGSTLMFVTFKDSMSSDSTMQTIEEIRRISDKNCKVSGMASVVLDTKNLSERETIMYVIIAVILIVIILEVSLDSYFVPVLLLLNIGIAILYNLGSNILLGEISYITKAISAVLQLGVTTDFAIFLYHSFMEEKEEGLDNEEAMGLAIEKTMTSVVGSSLTTIAGFLALCSMNFTLGKDLGLVMAKGVLFGVICVIIILPGMILECEKIIEKTKHKAIFPKFNHIRNFVIKHYTIAIVLFIILLPISYYGYKNTDVYYNLDKSLPKYLESVTANEELKDKFEMVTTEIVLVSNDVSANKVNEMLDKINEVDGIKFATGLSKLNEEGIPVDILPETLINQIQSKDYQLVLISSEYEMATDELNNQCDKVNSIIKEYDENAILAGEGALMKDLVEIADHDFKSVNFVSIGIIFVLMFIVLKSITLPIILIVVIELAIFINMGIPYYTGTILPFIASIVIGTIQLGATIDYAILLTNKYLSYRKENYVKKEAMNKALESSLSSIIVSGLCFFAATIGVGAYSEIEMIGSLCILMSRGAIISVCIVGATLPAFLMLFDEIICKTTIGMKNIK